MKLKTLVLLVLAMSSFTRFAFAQGLPYSWGAITNSPAAPYSDFGLSMAALGSQVLLIGAPLDSTGATNAGAVHLFGTNGALITTLTNPAPLANDQFGFSVAALGTDRVLVGAPYAHRPVGAVYLFSTNGTLLTAITNPSTPFESFFGFSVAAVGTNRVLVGAPEYGYSTGVSVLYVGAAYLFDTNGVLLTTFNNPNPTPTDFADFGWSVAGLGANRVLIGAPGDETAYLFGTNGNVFTSGDPLVTFGKHTPAGRYGSAVSAVGRDLVLIGAPSEYVGATSAGAAYVFNTNGVLVTSLTNPEPATVLYFGASLAAVRRDQVAIGSGETVYLLNTFNGSLLTTFTNPAPATYQWFGRSIAAVGNYGVLVGTSLAAAAGTASEAAFLFNLPQPTPPPLSVRLTATNTVVVSWPSALLFDPADWVYWNLQQTTSLKPPLQWKNAGYMDNGTTGTHIANPPTNTVFYRLFKPPL